MSAVLEECLRYLAGEKAPAKFTADINVIRECCLSSEHGVEIACDLSTRLDIEIPLKDNPLIHEETETGRRRGRKFGEVVEYLMRLDAKRQN